jgi:hypothetical protein
MAAMNLHEPAVALTDFGLAFECGLLWFLLWRRRPSHVVTGFELFFAATGMAALSGGLVHGYLSDEASLAYMVLWRASLMSIALAAVAAVVIGAKLCFGDAVAHAIRLAAFLGSTAYAAVVWLVRDDFITAIYAYVPAALFLLIGFGVALQRTRDARYSSGILGLLLTFVAAAVQRSTANMGVLDHNALYHVVQAVALVLICVSGRVPMEQMASAAAGGD